MRKIKKILAGLVASMMTFTLLTGCGNAAKSGDSSEKKIGIVLSTLNNPFFVKMKDGALAEAEKTGYDLVVLDSQNDPSKERCNVEDLVQMGVSAILLNPTDSDAVIGAVEVANENNIPVITLDRQSNGGEITSHIASDNVAGGEMAAEYILDLFGQDANINVVELQGTPGASATRDRGQGFHNILDGKPNVNIVSSQPADFDRQKGLQVMENIIQGNKDIQVVFAHNDEMALGATKAIAASNLDTVVIGFDGIEDGLEAVDKGEMKATVAQQADLIGALGVQLAEKLDQGETIDKQYVADLQMVD
ncbi:ribose-binding protein [Clostridium sp. DSM 8431]|uniref:ribose ABC transporter substrate-binding protein RbsB n=1 Tax=Clostridium sp. DSM 8431 TaxID=1761781 RepID=UPI0008E76AA8|nr:ribose ABC transporter substrate-binding protein RbsB [Clostridium sp. DSM 8431]SFU82911.1 ribose-binding protein [Clostridium sp. DSM 8431]